MTVSPGSIAPFPGGHSSARRADPPGARTGTAVMQKSAVTTLPAATVKPCVCVVYPARAAVTVYEPGATVKA